MPEDNKNTYRRRASATTEVWQGYILRGQVTVQHNYDEDLR